MDCVVHGIAKSWTRLSNFHLHFDLRVFLFFPHRFNCGTGVAIIVSETKIKLGGWHTVTLYRDGLNGLLQLNNGTPVTGQSQVSVRRTPGLCPALQEGPAAGSWQMDCFAWDTQATQL